VWDDARKARAREVKFNLSDMIPAELSLTQLEPVRSTGGGGIELEEMPSTGPLSLAARHTT